MIRYSIHTCILRNNAKNTLLSLGRQNFPKRKMLLTLSGHHEGVRG